MITHTSLDAFEQRAREGRVRSLVDADMRMIVALIEVARAARELAEHDQPPNVVRASVRPATDRDALQARLGWRLSCVPK